MVDVDTAMRASAYSDRKRKSGGGAGGKGNDEKNSRKIEPFDPVEHHQKERGDMLSMWLVIIYGLSVSAALRYVLMPTMEGPEAILYLIPLLLCGTVPTLHKILIPKKYSENYTKGNWFRACFLFIFSWLALSFALVNPPLADIASPTLAGGLDVSEADGVYATSWSGGVLLVELDQSSFDAVLGLAIRDNVDAETPVIEGGIYHRGEKLIDFGNGTVISNSVAAAEFDAVGNWTRGAKIAPHSEDVGLAWNLGELTPGTYTIHVVITEDGDPWTNVYDREFSMKVAMTDTA